MMLMQRLVPGAVFAAAMAAQQMGLDRTSEAVSAFLTSLSILWDFGVFTQPYLLIGQAHLHPSNYLMGVYLFEEGYLKSDYGRGAAISLLMLLMVAAMSVVYVRRMVKIGDVD